jgi:hypothetical protein
MTEKEYLEEIQARRNRVCELRDAGHKWKEIAAEMGVSVSRVSQIYMYGYNDAPEFLKESVRTLYGNKCAACKCESTDNSKLHVHHKYGPEHELENLMPLCVKCHSFLHKLKRRKDEAYNHFIKQFSKRVPEKLAAIHRLCTKDENCKSSNHYKVCPTS